MRSIRYTVFLPPIIMTLRRLFPKWQDDLDHYGIKWVPAHHVTELEIIDRPQYIWASTVPLTITAAYGSMISKQAWPYEDSSTPPTLSVSRRTFETLLRRLVVKYRDNVQYFSGTVTAFERAENDDSRLSGVRFRENGCDGVERTVSADFIVGTLRLFLEQNLDPNVPPSLDATGPGQMAYHKWLSNAGFGPIPPQQQYDPHQMYVTSIWTIPEHLREKVGTIIPHGLGTLPQYLNTPDWSTGEHRTLIIQVYERSQGPLRLCHLLRV